MDMEEEIANEFAGQKGGYSSRGNSGDAKQQSALNNQSQDVGTRSAEGHSQGEFTHPLGDYIRKNGVEAEGGKQQGDCGKTRD